MSLINEALRRADSNKRSNTGDGEQAPQLIPSPPGRPSRGFPRIKAAVVLIVVAGGALVGWKLLAGDKHGEAAPKTASAKSAAAVHPPTPGRTPAASPAKKHTTPQAKPGAALALTKTMEAPEYHKPTSPPTRMPAAAGSGAGAVHILTPAGAVETAGTAKTGGTTTRPATAALAAKTPAPPKPEATGPTTNVASALPATSKPAATKPAVASAKPPIPRRPRPARPPVNRKRWKLSGVIQGPDGAAAFVNGTMVTVGQEIDGAKVTKITKYAVHLEVGGETFAIRL